MTTSQSSEGGPPPDIDHGGLTIDRAAFSDPTVATKVLDVSAIVNSWAQRVGGLEDKSVLEIGCGEGAAAIGLALRSKPRELLGVDIAPLFGRAESIAREAGLESLPENLTFQCVDRAGFEARQRFDFIYSWSVLEHVDTDVLAENLAQQRAAMKDGAHYMFQVAPLFYSAEGSHLMHFGIPPWGHLLMQHNHIERAVFSHPGYEEPTKKGDWSCYNTLNKLTADELITHITHAGFELLFEYRTQDEVEPPPRLLAIYDRGVLTNNQVVAMFRVR